MRNSTTNDFCLQSCYNTITIQQENIMSRRIQSKNLEQNNRLSVFFLMKNILSTYFSGRINSKYQFNILTNLYACNFIEDGLL